jgi:hypothetical protein
MSADSVSTVTSPFKAKLISDRGRRSDFSNTAGSNIAGSRAASTVAKWRRTGSSISVFLRFAPLRAAGS